MPTLEILWEMIEGQVLMWSELKSVGKLTLCCKAYFFTSQWHYWCHWKRIYCCSSEDGEKKDHDKAKDEAPPELAAEEKRAPKKRLGQRKEPPEAFMASFFAGVEVYQTKMLVSYFPHSHPQKIIWRMLINCRFTTHIFSQNYLARNFYNLRFLALFVAFAINFILLFYKVSLYEDSLYSLMLIDCCSCIAKTDWLSGNRRLLWWWRPVERSRESRRGGRRRGTWVLCPAGEHGLHGTNASLSGNTAHYHIFPVCGGILLPEGTIDKKKNTDFFLILMCYVLTNAYTHSPQLYAAYCNTSLYYFLCFKGASGGV